MTDSYPVWRSGIASEGAAARAEPGFASVEELRAHRKRMLVTSYRLFGAFGWGSLGDGHITARDPERADAMWLIRYGVPFHRTTVDDLVLVGPDGRVDGGDSINMTAYYIHAPIHEARPETVAVAHTHTPYATPWAANVEPFRMICQEATAFFDDHEVYEGEEVQVSDFDTGKKIAATLGETKAVLLRNHGPVTVGNTVEEAIGWFLMLERVAEVHVKAPDARPISDEAALIAAREIGHVSSALAVFDYAAASKLPTA
ncbi:MAG: class II aldolase/adducin family protein [bacterium]|nr:class II aldolase/adducin family protein [bacterium]